MKMTDMLLRNLKPQAQRYLVWGDHGLGVRVSPKGRKSFVYMYRHEGKARFLTLGDYPRMTLADAHKGHAEARKKVEQGLDPGAEAVTERAEDRQAPTVATLVEEYIERWAKARKKSWKVDLRILQKDVLPEWGRLKAKDVTRRDVKDLLNKVLDRGAPIGANRLLALLRKMFNYAVDELEIIITSPCLKIKSPAPENRRDRVLTAAEIYAFWNGLVEARMAEGTKLILKLQLVTGQRKGEIVSAAWEEIDLTDRWWTIPAKQTMLRLTHNVEDGLAKNKLAHRVFLAPMAVELLQRVKALSGDSPWLFPSPRGNKPISGAAVDHALRLALSSLERAHFTPHDLRRSAATFMTGSCGIPRLVVSKILNHAEPHITAVYDRASYDREKQMAMEAWARRLQAIIEGTKSNVVSMVRGV